jgi:hypothetical protein
MTRLLFALATLLLCGDALAQCNDDCAFIKHVIASGDTKFADKPLWSFGGRCFSDLEGRFTCKVDGQFDQLKPEYDRLVSALPAALGTGWTITDGNPSHISKLVGLPLFVTIAKPANSERGFHIRFGSIDQKKGTAFLGFFYETLVVPPLPGYPSDKKLSPSFRNVARNLYDCLAKGQEHLGEPDKRYCKDWEEMQAARLNEADAYMERLIGQFSSWLNNGALRGILSQGQAKQEAFKQAVDNAKDCREEAWAGLNTGTLSPQTTCTAKPVK